MKTTAIRNLTRVLFLLVSFGFGSLQADVVRGAQAAAAQTKKPAATRTSTAKPAAKPAVKSASKKRYSSAAARARRARLAQARAAAAARAAAEARIPRFKTDSSGAVIPDLHAAAAIIYNPETGEVLWEENSQNQRSIASITKVMTATVFLESEPDLDAVVTIDPSDTRRASTTFLRSKDRLATRDLLHLLLIASDNAAARALARTSKYGGKGFVERMNEKALELGLTSTAYTDPSGLDATNVSSAYDMARLIAYAASDERISTIMRMPSYTFATSRRKAVTINSTNQLVRGGDIDVRGGKTGFINKSGYCLATLLNLPDLNQQVAVVVLGARSNAGRFTETRNLFTWLSTKAQELLSKKVPQ